MVYITGNSRDSYSFRSGSIQRLSHISSLALSSSLEQGLILQPGWPISSVHLAKPELCFPEFTSFLLKYNLYTILYWLPMSHLLIHQLCMLLNTYHINRVTRCQGPTYLHSSGLVWATETCCLWLEEAAEQQSYFFMLGKPMQALRAVMDCSGVTYTCPFIFRGWTHETSPVSTSSSCTLSVLGQVHG